MGLRSASPEPMGKRIATACQVWVCVRRAHLFERLLQLVQLVKAQRLQVDPTIAIGHLRGTTHAGPFATEGERAARGPCCCLFCYLLHRR